MPLDKLTRFGMSAALLVLGRWWHRHVSRSLARPAPHLIGFGYANKMTIAQLDSEGGGRRLGACAAK